MFKRKITGLAVAASTMLFSGTALQAATLSSGAYAAGVKVGAISTVSADAAVGQTSGSTPGAYNVPGSAATINQTTNLGSVLGITAFDKVSSGVVTTSATSNGTTTATGTVNVANPTLQLGSSTTLFGQTSILTALGLTADAITSTSTVSVVNGMLVGSGNATIANLGLTGSLLNALNLGTTLISNPAANTTVFTLAGLTLALNEQIRTGNGIDALTMQTNALHLTFNNYVLGASTLNGDLVLGHSEASITGFSPLAAVPEPTSWAMMVGGFGLIGGMLRNSRRKPATVFA